MSRNLQKLRFIDHGGTRCQPRHATGIRYFLGHMQGVAGAVGSPSDDQIFNNRFIKSVGKSCRCAAMM